MSLRDQLLTADTPSEIADVLDEYVRTNLVSTQIDASGATELVVGGGVFKPVLAGVIVLAKPTVDGVSTSLAQQITSQVISTTMAGEKLLYSTVVRDDFGDMAARILTNPGEILVPAGVLYAEMVSSLQFPAEAASGANGIRWNRVVSGATPTHRGNSGARPAVADATNTLQTVGALMDVTPGDYYYTTAIQNCGSNLTLGVGNASNNWASNWFMMKFYK